MEIAHEVLPDDPAGLAELLEAAEAHMAATVPTYVFVVPKGAIAQYVAAPDGTPGQRLMRRAEAIGHIVSAMYLRSLAVATASKTARELQRDFDRPENLYVVGSTGCASSIALGVALRAPGRRVLALDGDGPRSHGTIAARMDCGLLDVGAGRDARIRLDGEDSRTGYVRPVDVLVEADRDAPPEAL
ncbi:hypothetical protein ACIA8F_22015 [Streptomyces sp. NPDC051563]|uniref:hypothetical protein n=1 Tax=Streptomyces sp. NPDC051563 TaxID=3365659 RepID=UPI0037AA60C6